MHGSCGIPKIQDGRHAHFETTIFLVVGKREKQCLVQYYGFYGIQLNLYRFEEIKARQEGTKLFYVYPT